jgi:hypothetical protein
VGDTTVPPEDCVIANNVMRSGDGPLINVINTPVNMVYEGNILFGASTGIGTPSGVTVVDPLLSLAADGLMRPATNSPVINAAAGSYPAVTLDMDGQTRSGAQDVGADEVLVSAPPVKPVGPDDVGPRWMRPSTLHISEVVATPVGAVITFADLTGLSPRYTLERREDLLAGDWAAVTNHIPVGYTSAVFTMIDPTAASTSVYYRVVNQ